jgi:hypothetical protein
VLTELATNALRGTLRLLEGAEHDVEKHTPLEEPAHEAIAALHRTADSMDRRVKVLESVASTLPALVEVLGRLSGQVGEALALAAPLEAVEREAAGIAHLFRRHHHDEPEPPTD